jgi:predicted SAM-dependent methyltransferase
MHTTSLKLDLGCGGQGSQFGDHIGVDVWPAEGIHSEHARTNYIQADISSDGLPFSDNTADEVICSHVLEHMTREDALRFLSEAVRVLKPEGSIHCYVPDLRCLARAYLVADHTFYAETYPDGTLIHQGPTIADRFLDGILGMGPYGHRYGYDQESLECLMREVGLIDIIKLPDRGRHEVGAKGTKA